MMIAPTPSFEFLTGDVARRCLASRVRLLDRTVVSVFNDALREHGLLVTQMNLLVAISKMESPTVADLASFLLLERSTLSRNLKRMEARGWISKIAGEDGRTLALDITEAGRALLRAAYPDWQAAQETVEDLLGAGTLGAIDRAVGACASEETQPHDLAVAAREPSSGFLCVYTCQ